jgi:hypothetical protein
VVEIEEPLRLGERRLAILAHVDVVVAAEAASPIHPPAP